MANKKPTETTKEVWTFTNRLAITVVMSCLIFLFVTPYLMSKFESKDNTLLSQIVTSVQNMVMVIIAFYFGSSMGQAKQQAQITEMTKNATDLATKTADAAISSAAGTGSSEVKVDKGIKIGELRAALALLNPDSEEAKKILSELEELEKQSN